MDITITADDVTILEALESIEDEKHPYYWLIDADYAPYDVDEVIDITATFMGLEYIARQELKRVAYDLGYKLDRVTVKQATNRRFKRIYVALDEDCEDDNDCVRIGIEEYINQFLNEWILESIVRIERDLAA